MKLHKIEDEGLPKEEGRYLIKYINAFSNCDYGICNFSFNLYDMNKNDFDKEDYKRPGFYGYECMGCYGLFEITNIIAWCNVEEIEDAVE